MTTAERMLLLRAVCHADPRTAFDAWSELCASTGGPNAVIDAANTGSEQRLLPLLGTRDKLLSLEPEIVGLCDDATATAWGLNLRLINEITPVLRAWKNAGVNVLALKGLALLGDIYPEHQLRPLGDADLLVRRDQLGLALHTLGQLGWTVPRSKALHFRGGGTAVNFGNDTGASIDIHLRPSRNIPVRSGNQLAVWNDIESLPASNPLNGLGMRRPSAVQQAITLIAHIARPCNDYMAHPLVDLHRLFTRRTELHTAEAARALVDAARHEHMSLRTAQVLTQLVDTLGTRLPLDPRSITPPDAAAEYTERAAMAAEERIAITGIRHHMRDLALVSTTGQGAGVKLRVSVGLLLRRTIARAD